MTSEATAFPRSASASVGEETTRSASTTTNGATHLAGTLWFVGWLFTIGFAQLVWWKAALAVILWPYFLGLALG